MHAGSAGHRLVSGQQSRLHCDHWRYANRAAPRHPEGQFLHRKHVNAQPHHTPKSNKKPTRKRESALQSITGENIWTSLRMLLFSCVRAVADVVPKLTPDVLKRIDDLTGTKPQLDSVSQMVYYYFLAFFFSSSLFSHSFVCSFVLTFFFFSLFLPSLSPILSPIIFLSALIYLSLFLFLSFFH